MKLLQRIWARLTGATGDEPIDDSGAGLDFGGRFQPWVPSQQEEKPQ